MVKVYIGTEEEQWLPTMVLKHSAQRRTNARIEFHELKNIPLKLNLKMFTGFSFYRYAIPELCHYEGRAIYLDADTIVLFDLEELFTKEMLGKGALARPSPPISYYTSVMLLECSKLKTWRVQDWVTMINADIASYHGTMVADPTGLNYRDFGPLEEFWNHLDRLDETTKIIHYTNVGAQPWKAPGHKHADVFLSELRKALDDQVLNRQDVEKEIAAGHIYPNILQDMDKLSSCR